MLERAREVTRNGKYHRNDVGTQDEGTFLFWDYPNIGSLSRADGFRRAQTRQIGPFCGSDRTLQSYDRGKEERGADTAGSGRKAFKTAVVRCQIRRRRAADRCRGIHSDLPRDLGGFDHAATKTHKARLNWLPLGWLSEFRIASRRDRSFATQLVKRGTCQCFCAMSAHRLTTDDL